MAGILTEAGYEITGESELYCYFEIRTLSICADNATIADLWLLNSCTVKTPSEDQLKNYVRQAVGDESSRKVPVKHVTCTR
jgi:tRNA A37 methylthiotransferase MiaB